MGNVGIPWSGVDSPLQQMARLLALRKMQEGQNSRTAWGEVIGGPMNMIGSVYRKNQEASDEAAKQQRGNDYLDAVIKGEEGQAEHAQSQSTPMEPSKDPDESAYRGAMADGGFTAGGNDGDAPAAQPTPKVKTEISELDGHSDQSTLARIAGKVLDPWMGGGKSRLDNVLKQRAQLAAKLEIRRLAQAKQSDQAKIWGQVAPRLEGDVSVPPYMRDAMGGPTAHFWHSTPSGGSGSGQVGLLKWIETKWRGSSPGQQLAMLKYQMAKSSLMGEILGEGADHGPPDMTPGADIPHGATPNPSPENAADSPENQAKKAKVAAMVGEVAGMVGLPNPAMLWRVIQKESSGGLDVPTPGAGPKGQHGEGQVTTETFNDYAPRVQQYLRTGEKPDINNPKHVLIVAALKLKDGGANQSTAFRRYNGAGPAARAYAQDAVNGMSGAKEEYGRLQPPSGGGSGAPASGSNGIDFMR